MKTTTRKTAHSLTGRYEYLSAISKNWPEVLKVLQRDVFPDYLGSLAATTISISQTLDPPMDRWKRIEKSQDLEDLKEKMRYWAIHHQFRDDWLMDAAVQTMRWWSESKAAPRYIWLYTETDAPRFCQTTPLPETWFPQNANGGETWDSFSGRLLKDMRRQLNLYRSTVIKYYGIDKGNLPRDARWTVLFQKGQTASQISRELPRANKEPIQTVSKAVKRFARSIGLTLRTSPGKDQ